VALALFLVWFGVVMVHSLANGLNFCDIKNTIIGTLHSILGDICKQLSQDHAELFCHACSECLFLASELF
jgi:hypothetical protein